MRWCSRSEELPLSLSVPPPVVNELSASSDVLSSSEFSWAGVFAAAGVRAATKPDRSGSVDEFVKLEVPRTFKGFFKSDTAMTSRSQLVIPSVSLEFGRLPSNDAQRHWRLIDISVATSTGRELFLLESLCPASAELMFWMEEERSFLLLRLRRETFFSELLSVVLSSEGFFLFRARAAPCGRIAWISFEGFAGAGCFDRDCGALFGSIEIP